MKGSQIADTISMSDDRAIMVLHDRDAALRAFYNTTSRERGEAAFDRLTPEPANIGLTPIVLSAQRSGRFRAAISVANRISRSCRSCSAMVARQPCETYSLDTDHSPFYSAPDELAVILHQLAGS